MTPNQITFLRVGLALLAIATFQLSFWATAMAVLLTAIAILLDGVDGYVARRTGTSTKLGAALDILGDRIVEDSYLIFFASSGLISFWIPVIFIVRGIATDFLRGIAQNQGLTAFGKSDGMLTTWWGRQLVGSRWSRAAYGVLKGVMFCYLGSLLLIRSATTEIQVQVTPVLLESLSDVGIVLAYSALVFCLIRGIPVFWEGRWLLQSDNMHRLRGVA
jgi:phosphatidylglycerophosphate synthase